MFFAAVDVTALGNFLQSLLPSISSVDPVVAGVGAIALFVLQIAGGNRVDVWGTVKWVLGRIGGQSAAPSVAVPADLNPAEAGVVQTVLDGIKKARAATAAQSDVIHSGLLGGVLKDVVNKIEGKTE